MKRRRLVILILAPVALVASLGMIATAVGLSIPRRHVASRTLRTRQPPEVVWRTITDYENLPKWRAELKAVVRLPDREGREVWREVYERGTPVTLETVEMDAPRYLVRAVADEGGPFSGRWEYSVEADGSGSRLTITEHGEVPNPFFRLVSRFFLGHTYFMEKYERDLARKFGEEAVIASGNQ